MRAKTHMVTGGTTGAYVTAGLVAAGVPVGHAIIAGTAGTVLGSILPDLDHHSSLITFSLGPVTMILSWLIRGAPIWFASGGYLLPWTRCEHRGFTHRPEGWLTFAIVFAILGGAVFGHPFAWGLAVFMGCATHTWGDCRTLAGVSIRRDADPTHFGTPFPVERGDYVAVQPSGVAGFLMSPSGRPHMVLTEEARLRRYCYVPICAVSWVFALWVTVKWGVPATGVPPG